MARRRTHSRRQAKPTELLFGYTIIAAGLVSVGVFAVPSALLVPLAVILLCIATLGGMWFYYFVYLKEQARREALLTLDINQVDAMGGVEFENYIEALFRRDDYRTEGTPRTGDYGVDLIAIKDGRRIAVQCKRHKGSIGQEAIREVYAGMQQYKCTVGVVITNSHFTKHATTLAATTQCILIDREELGLLASKRRSIDDVLFAFL